MSKTTQILITLSLVLTACGGSDFTAGESTGGNSGVSNISVAGIAGMDTSKSTGGSSPTDTSTVVKATGGSSVKGTTGPSSSTGGQGLGTGGSSPSSTGGSNPGTGGSKATGGSSTTSTGGSSTCKPATCEQVCQGSATQCSSVTDPINYPISCPKSDTCGSTMQCYCSLGVNPGTGGNTSTGGSSALGTGGSKATGGSSNPGTGGSNPGTGGSPSTGGSSAQGTGGTPGTGGSSAITTGGSPSTGGSSAQGTGGTPGTGGTTSTKITAKSISVGFTNTCVVLSDSTVDCWASNSTTINPTKVAGLTNVASVSAGYDHICVVLTSGLVKCWGNNNYGQLGNGTTTNSATPVTVNLVATATAVAASSSYTCALITNGTVECWGSNSRGQLGRGGSAVGGSDPNPAYVAVTGPTSISAGTYQACSVLTNGTIQCWGNGNPTPTRAQGNGASVAIGNNSAYSLESATGSSGYMSQVWSWGSNTNGQLGTGDTLTYTHATTVSGLSTATAISAGVSQACALLTNGTVQCWGVASQEQSDGTLTTSYLPVTVSEVTNAVAISSSADSLVTCVILSDGSVECWGPDSSNKRAFMIASF